MNTVVNIFNMENSVSVYRITNRLKALVRLEFGTSHDTVRFELMGKIFTEFTNFLIPSGLIGKAVGQYGIYKDAPVIFLYSAFGSFLGILLVIVFITKAFSSTIKSITLYKDQMLVFSSCFSIYIILFLLNGTFLMSTYDVCLTGVVFGMWFNKNRVEFV